MKVLAVRHVEFENLGILEDILKSFGYDVTYLDTPKGDRLKGDVDEFGLAVILGGYMGAYEEEKYPFLSYEYELIDRCAKKGIPVLGICLGAQMLAKFLGARVYKGEKGKEIGWMEVFKVEPHPYFEEFPERLKVLQWHGDTFDLPQGAVRVFSSEKYPNQGFVYGNFVGLQFHLEVTRSHLKPWIEAYKEELEKEGIKEKDLFNGITEEEEKTLKRLSESFLKKLINNQKV